MLFRAHLANRFYLFLELDDLVLEKYHVELGAFAVVDDRLEIDVAGLVLVMFGVLVPSLLL